MKSSKKNDKKEIKITEAKRKSEVYSVSYPPHQFTTGLNYIRTTKYTLLSFLPLNLKFQFRRYYNIYFLVAALTVLSGQTAFSPITQVFPLVLVITAAAIKDGYEDYQRYKQDKNANNSLVSILRNGTIEKILAKDIMPGDFVYFEKGEKFPVDAVIISTSFEDGSCFVDTAELDGETNLKRRVGCNELLHLTSKESIQQLNGQIQCEQPNQNLLAFEGRLDIPESFKLNEGSTNHVIPLNINNLLLKGAVLRNTEHVWGLVLYTGQNTKIMKNMKKAKLKSSVLEASLNKFTLAAFILNIGFLVSSVLLELRNYYFIRDSQEQARQSGSQPNDFIFEWYLGSADDSVPQHITFTVLSYFAVYTYVIPISLFVSIEIARLAQGLFMYWDKKMTLIRWLPDGTRLKQRMRPNNTNLNEELAMVEYAFSDKTGTLTQNEMVLAKFFINGHVFDDMKQPGSVLESLKSKNLPSGDKIDPLTQEYAILFQRALALAHDVLPSFDKNGNRLYESASPDETALLNAAAGNHFRLIEKTKNATTITTPLNPLDARTPGQLGGGAGDTFYSSEEQVEHYTPLELLEFTSDRKRMSIVVKTADGKIHLYCKGADNIMMARLKEDETLNPPELITNANRALENFSREGLRTLVVGWKEIPVEQYKAFREAYSVAERAIEGRDAELAAACEMIEVDLQFLGCTAIEDRLQDEVPETIDYLLKAHVKVWLLTGDKQETAINIGFSSKLLNQSMSIHKLNVGKDNDETRLKLVELRDNILNNPALTHALVVEGAALGQVFAFDNETQQIFLEAGTRCRSVICCRVTPLQKSQVVKLVRSAKKCVTLAIGDGANDVTMIQSANIGVGIMGREGTQAVRASDYAFGEFRFLRRLMAVHGRYSYLRLATMMMFSFYKNITLIAVMWWFGFQSAWSGQIVYEEVFMTAYNIVFTSLPPFIMGVFDKDVNDEFIEKYPQLYRQVKANQYWTFWTVTGWMASAIWHSTAIFGTVWFVSQDGVISFTGRSAGYWVQTSFFGTPVLASVLLKFCLATKTFNWITWFGLGISLILNLVALMVLEYFGFSEPGTGIITHTSPTYYLVVVLLPILCNIPDLVCMYSKRQYAPHDSDIIGEEQKVAHSLRRFGGKKNDNGDEIEMKRV